MDTSYCLDEYAFTQFLDENYHDSMWFFFEPKVFPFAYLTSVCATVHAVAHWMSYHSALLTCSIPSVIEVFNFTPVLWTAPICLLYGNHHHF